MNGYITGTMKIKKKSYSMNNYRPIIGQLRKLQTAKTESSRIRQFELITRSESEFVIKKKNKTPIKEKSDPV